MLITAEEYLTQLNQSETLEPFDNQRMADLLAGGVDESLQIFKEELDEPDFDVEELVLGEETGFDFGETEVQEPAENQSIFEKLAEALPAANQPEVELSSENTFAFNNTIDSGPTQG